MENRYSKHSIMNGIDSEPLTITDGRNVSRSDTNAVSSESIRNLIGQTITADLGLANLMQIREMLEPNIAACAAQMATPEHIYDMHSAIDVMELSLTDAALYIEADQRFHHALAKATRNQLLLRFIDPIADLLTEQRLIIFHAGTGGAGRGQYHHKRIFEAIVQGDSDAARHEMIAHLKQVQKDSGVS